MLKESSPSFSILLYHRAIGSRASLTTFLEKSFAVNDKVY